MTTGERVAIVGFTQKNKVPETGHLITCKMNLLLSDQSGKSRV